MLWVCFVGSSETLTLLVREGLLEAKMVSSTSMVSYTSVSALSIVPGT